MKNKMNILPHTDGINRVSTGTRGFTLIELIIAISISSILMLSIIIFVGSSIKEITKNEKILSSDNSNLEFEQKFLNTISNTNGIYYSGASFGEYLTGIFLKTKNPNLPITFIGLKTFTGFCDSYSGVENATGTIQKLVIKEFILPEFSQSGVILGGKQYYLSHSGNVVYSGSEIIIGSGLPGNDLDEDNPLKTELNLPSAIIGTGNFLYIADTFNDRILYYNITTKKIKQILGKTENINKPVSLYFNSNELLIANNGNGKVLSYKDGKGTGDILNLNFKVGLGFTANKISLNFPLNINSPSSTGAFIFSGITGTGASDFVSTGTYLIYNFTSSNIFSTGTTYGIKINGIDPVSTTEGSYYVKIDFYSGSDLNYSDYFPYFTKGDGDLNTNTGNNLKTLSGGFDYIYNINGLNSFSGKIIDWSWTLNNSIGKEIISNFPVKDLNFNLLNSGITIKFNYYKYYDCLEEKHIIKEKVFKKSL